MKKLILFFFVLCANVTFAQTPRTSNLVGSYQFNSNANDTSGSVNNGTAFGFPTLTTDRFNNVNSAYSFDGNNYFYFGNSMANQINNIFSISLWLNQTSTSPTDLIGLGYQTCGGSAGPIIRAGSTMNFNRCNAGFDTSDNTSNDGNWHQFVFVYDGSSRKIYRDGALLSNLNGGGIFTINTYGLVLGKSWYNNSGGNFYQGKADDLNIWNVALSSSEISQLYSYENSNPNSNSAPTNIVLSSSSINENVVSGTTVGGFTTTDVDSGDTFTYTLVTGSGATDNANFSISGANLLTNTAPDYETKSSYSIRIQTSDGTATYAKAFTINIANVNDAPTDIILSSNSINENIATSTSVGILSSTDDDSGDMFTYSLVSGTGDADNASFSISSANLLTATTLDFETKSSYSIRIQTSDGNETYQEVFIISVADVNEAPTNIAISATSIDENVTIGTAVSGLTSTDVDSEDTHVYTLASGDGDADNSSFTIGSATSTNSYALNFDGTNDHISTTIDSDLQAMPSTTWSGWIKPTGVSGWQVIFGMEDGGWDRMLIIEPGSLQLSMGQSSGRWQTGVNVLPNVWQHVVAIYDNGAMRLYFNGVQYSTSSSEGNHSSTGMFTIGGNQTHSPYNYYRGLIDEVAVWDEALSASEISTLYNI